MTIENYCKETAYKTKEKLRTRNRELRKNSFSSEKNDRIVENIRSLECYRNAKNIMAFYPLKYEIDLRKLMTIDNKIKNFFLPKLENDEMNIYKFEGEEKLKEGKFHIQEPISEEKINPEILDLVILPALAADLNGNRLGYGKGCYDRFLSSFDCRAILALPILSDLIVKSVPVDKFDKKAHVIVTEKGKFLLNI